MERLLSKWHLTLARDCLGVLCFYIIKRKASRAGLSDVATRLEWVAKEIRAYLAK